MEAVRVSIAALGFHHRLDRAENLRLRSFAPCVSRIQLRQTPCHQPTAVTVVDDVMGALIPEVTIVRGLQQGRYPQWVFAQIHWLCHLMHHPRLDRSPWIRFTTHINVREIARVHRPQNLPRLAILLDDTHPQLFGLGHHLVKRPPEDLRLDGAAYLDRLGNVQNGARRYLLSHPETALCNR